MPTAEIRDHETGLVSGPFSWFQSRQILLQLSWSREVSSKNGRDSQPRETDGGICPARLLILRKKIPPTWPYLGLHV